MLAIIIWSIGQISLLLALPVLLIVMLNEKDKDNYV